MNNIPAEKFVKIGFASKTAAKQFIQSNSLRKKANESIPSFLKRVKETRIAKKKFDIEQRRQYPVHGPKRKPPNWHYREVTINAPPQQMGIVYKRVTIGPQKESIYYKKVTSKPETYKTTESAFYTHLVSHEEDEVIELRLKSETHELNNKILEVTYTAHYKNDSEQGVILTDEVIEQIYNACNEVYIKNKNEVLEKKNLKNIDTWAQITYFDSRVDVDVDSGTVNKRSSHTFQNSFDETNVLGKLHEKCNQHANTVTYAFYFWEFRIIYRIPSTQGGCLKGSDHSSKRIPTEDKDVWIHLDYYKGENNNCLFSCLNSQYKVKGSRGSAFYPDTIRRKLNITLKTEISHDQICQVIDYYNSNTSLNKGFVLFNETHQLLNFYNVPSKSSVECIYGKFDENIIPLYLLNNHYYIFKVKNKIYCQICHQQFNEDYKDHECRVKVVEYTAKRLGIHLKKAFGNDWFKKNTAKTLKGEYHVRFDKLSEADKLKAKKLLDETKLVIPYTPKKKEKPKIIINYDFETRRNQVNNKHEVYTVGYSLDSDKKGEWHYIYFQKEGESVIDRFINYLKKLSDENSESDIIINAFNSAGYDSHLLMEGIAKQGWSLNYVESNRRIIILKFLNISVFDVCAFVNTSLKKACEDFEVSDENCKKEFKHEKMVTDDDLITHKDECLSYLKNDILGLKELTTIINDIMYKRSGLSIYNFITLSHMAYTQWTSYLEKIVIEIPSYEKWEKYIRPATFGGRCNPFKKYYQSKWYDDVIKMKDEIESVKCKELAVLKQLIKEAPNKKAEKKLKEERAKIYSSMAPLYKKIREDGDFIFNADVTSLYPSAMGGFNKNESLFLPNSKYNVNIPMYPTGYSSEIEGDITKCKESFKSGKLGFYEITYTCPKKKIIPVLPKAKFLGNKRVGVIFDLEDGKGIFTSVDIENAKAFGYKTKFTGNALIYETKSSEVFSDYVENYKTLKMEAERDENSALRSMAKLMLNALYGKTLQRPIISDTKVISKIGEFDEFVKMNNLTDFHKINGTDKYVITGNKKDKNTCMTKPSQMGSFVTGYSRRIMLFYISQMDPTLEKFTFTYTDTDSLHVYGEFAKILEKNGFLTEKKNSDFGFLCSDIDDEGIIIREINLGPKSYMYEYITIKGEFGVVMKTKGVPKEYLKINLFNNEKTEEIKFNNPNKPVFRKTGTNPNRKQLSNDLGEFSIYTVTDMSRTFLKTPWSRYQLKDNSFYPPGYDAEYIYPVENDEEEE